jgi:hypothetical protein
MGGNYASDNFTESDVMAQLERAGLRYRNGTRYILSQCPLHEDQNASAQIYKDDWFVKCHAGCEGGRFHITKAFPELRGGSNSTREVAANRPSPKATEVKYTPVNLMEMWAAMDEIPEDHYFKGIPIEILNDLGWRYDAQHERYFIPYFSRSKKTIPFGQWRNLGHGPRFNFWKDAKPTMYGTWNLEPGETLFLVEGCSDAAVLDFCAVPWIAAPSAASGELVKAMAAWCKENRVTIVYAGDNDEAGDKLKDALSSVMSYRVKQPRHPYKDWGEMFEAEGLESVQNYCFDELGIEPWQPPADIEAQKTLLEKVQDVFPGAVELKIVGGEKEQSKTQPTLL